MNKIWEFSGRGNYSISFGWDDGLRASLGHEISLEAALQKQDAAVEYSHYFNTASLDNAEKEGVFEVFENEHGGSRNTWGFVVAPNEQRAEELLSKYEKRWKVIES